MRCPRDRVKIERCIVCHFAIVEVESFLPLLLSRLSIARLNTPRYHYHACIIVHFKKLVACKLLIWGRVSLPYLHDEKKKLPKRESHWIAREVVHPSAVSQMFWPRL